MSLISLLQVSNSRIDLLVIFPVTFPKNEDKLYYITFVDYLIANKCFCDKLPNYEHLSLGRHRNNSLEPTTCVVFQCLRLFVSYYSCKLAATLVLLNHSTQTVNTSSEANYRLAFTFFVLLALHCSLATFWRWQFVPMAFSKHSLDIAFYSFLHSVALE